MQSPLWTCQYTGCRSTTEQIAALRSRRPDGFPHDEDQNLRVCTVCRRLPLKERPAEEDQLDRAFITGIKEELASIVENEKNIQALSQVFRYYAKYAKQLSQLLYDFATRQCFPWELIHALHLVDDILLMDNTGRYKTEFTDRVQAIAVNAFRKVQSDQEKREIARMLHAWQELKIFDTTVLDTIRSTISSGNIEAGRILNEAGEMDEEDEDDAPVTEVFVQDVESPVPMVKKRKLGENDATNDKPLDSKTTPTPKLSVEKVYANLNRILVCPVDRPFEMLGIVEKGSNGHDIRKAYRRIALLIHPDKNPGMEAQCQEALIKLQQGREQAENELQRLDAGSNEPKNGETRSAATAAAATAAVDASFKCKYPGCDLTPCKQCANGCCTRNITHCHMIARGKGGLQCFFHPPPRAWARNA